MPEEEEAASSAPRVVRGAGAPPTLQLRTVKVVALTPVPLGVATSIVPLLAPDGTVNLILVAAKLRALAPRLIWSVRQERSGVIAAG
jgi:hypothetical protein